VRRLARLGLAACLLALPLAGCGKKGPPAVPAGEVSTYPRPYPMPTQYGGAAADEVPAAPTPSTPAKPDANAKPPQ
jgi:predicted small lipoprotein YifL